MSESDSPDNGRHAHLPELPESALEERERMIAAMEDAHEFPGFYKVVVIASADDSFRAAFLELVEVTQAELPFRVEQRPSSKGNYIAYHLEIFVVSAADALERKTLIAQLEGVRVLL